MEFALVLRELGRQRKWIVLGAVIAAVIAMLAVFQVKSVFPPRLHTRALQHSTASTEVYIDHSVSSLGDTGTNLQPLVDISNVLAHVMATPTLLNLIGQDAHIPGDEIYASGPIEPNLTRFVQEPSQGKRASEVAGETNPYRLEFDNDGVIPVVSIYSQAPTNAQAVALADGAARALSQYETSVENEGDTPTLQRVDIRQLGVPTAAVADSGITKKLGLLVFVGVLILWCGLILLIGRFRRSWRESGQVAALRRDLADPEPPSPAEGARADGLQIGSDPYAIPVYGVDVEATYAHEGTSGANAENEQ
jgi:hypothetical protein